MAETTYRVHGGLHHNGVFYPHGSTVAASLFSNDNPMVGDELKTLIHAGTLKTEAEFTSPAQLQSALNEKDAEIERLKAELAEATAKRDAEMAEARTEGPAEAGSDEQFPKSTL